jgi:hypothetical protein
MMRMVFVVSRESSYAWSVGFFLSELVVFCDSLGDGGSGDGEVAEPADVVE